MYLGFNKPSDHGQLRDGETQTRASHRISHDPKDYAALGVNNYSVFISIFSDVVLIIIVVILYVLLCLCICCDYSLFQSFVPSHSDYSCKYWISLVKNIY